MLELMAPEIGNSIVVTTIHGGPGNLLFQRIACKAAANERNAAPKICGRSSNV